MTTYAENLPTAEVPEYPSAEQLTDTCIDALRLYNIAGGNFGPWTTTKDNDGAHFTKPFKRSKLLSGEVHISLPEDGTYGVDISRTARTFTGPGHDSYTQVTALRPNLDPAGQPEVITRMGQHMKDLYGDNVSEIIDEKTGPLSSALLNSVSKDLQVVLQSNSQETVDQNQPGRFARLVGRLAFTS